MPLSIVYQFILLTIGGLLINGSAQALPIVQVQTSEQVDKTKESVDQQDPEETLTQPSPKLPVLGYGVGVLQSAKNYFELIFRTHQNGRSKWNKTMNRSRRK